MPNFTESWSYEEVGEWLKQIGLGKYAELFCRHEINGEILLTMTENDMSAPPLNVDTFGSLRKFGIELEKLKTNYKQRLEPLVPSSVAVADFSNILSPVVNNAPIVAVTAAVETMNIVKSATKSVATEFETRQTIEETIQAAGNSRQFLSEFGVTSTNLEPKKKPIRDLIAEMLEEENHGIQVLKEKEKKLKQIGHSSNDVEAKMGLKLKKEPVRDLMAEMLEEDKRRIRLLKEKEKKLKQGEYSNDLEALLDGAPGFMEADTDDEDAKQQQQQPKKGKTLKQMKRDALWKVEGKALPEPPVWVPVAPPPMCPMFTDEDDSATYL